MWVDELIKLLGKEKILVSDSERETFSKDFYWYSPILHEQLKDKVADCIAVPHTVQEVKTIISFAVKNRISLTIRGAGTGNYGQAIPLNGGIVLDMTKLNQILEVNDQSVRVQAGVKLGVLEKYLRTKGRELRIFPSTYLKSTVGGFVCGGSGGIGSIRWGNLWDQNIESMTIMTVEEEPKLIHVSGPELEPYIHNYGTAGIVMEVSLFIEPKTEWEQHIVYFDSFQSALLFCDELAHDESIIKRLISVCEWPIPVHFQSILKFLPNDKSIAMLEIAEKRKEELQKIVHKYKGEIGFSILAAKYQKGIKVSDFTWNHSTLWAHKLGDNNITYLQANFQKERIFEQIDAIRNKFGDEVLFHFEYIKTNGEVTPSSLPIIHYQSEKRLNEIINFFIAQGVEINNPHTYLLGFGGYNIRINNIVKEKQKNDPYSLLNPGKIPTGSEIVYY
jgi:hypothetical protein